MTPRRDKVDAVFAEPAVRIFAVNDRLNQILIENLNPAVWKAQPPGKVRTIAAVFAHMQNVRTKWIRLTTPHLGVPAQLNRSRCTPSETRKALARSATVCEKMLAELLSDGGRVKEFRRDGWARAWPAGPEMLCYMISHEAHHRGQIAILAHQLGFPLPGNVTSELWNWEKLLKW